MPTKKNYQGNQQNYDPKNGEYENGPASAFESFENPSKGHDVATLGSSTKAKKDNEKDKSIGGDYEKSVAFLKENGIDVSQFKHLYDVADYAKEYTMKYGKSVINDDPVFGALMNVLDKYSEDYYNEKRAENNSKKNQPKIKTDLRNINDKEGINEEDEDTNEYLPTFEDDETERVAKIKEHINKGDLDYLYDEFDFDEDETISNAYFDDNDQLHIEFGSKQEETGESNEEDDSWYSSPDSLRNARDEVNHYYEEFVKDYDLDNESQRAEVIDSMEQDLESLKDDMEWIDEGSHERKYYEEQAKTNQEWIDKLKNYKNK